MRYRDQNGKKAADDAMWNDQRLCINASMHWWDPRYLPARLIARRRWQAVSLFGDEAYEASSHE